eukprot:Clim_evm15s229 gene=Clim_evmTU15s229
MTDLVRKLVRSVGIAPEQTKPAPPPTFDDMPDNILKQIFRHIKDVQDLTACAHTCQKFRKILTHHLLWSQTIHDRHLIIWQGDKSCCPKSDHLETGSPYARFMRLSRHRHAALSKQFTIDQMNLDLAGARVLAYLKQAKYLIGVKDEALSLLKIGETTEWEHIPTPHHIHFDTTDVNLVVCSGGLVLTSWDGSFKLLCLPFPQPLSNMTDAQLENCLVNQSEYAEGWKEVELPSDPRLEAWSKKRLATGDHNVIRVVPSVDNLRQPVVGYCDLAIDDHPYMIFVRVKMNTGQGFVRLVKSHAGGTPTRSLSFNEYVCLISREHALTKERSTTLAFWQDNHFPTGGLTEPVEIKDVWMADLVPQTATPPGIDHVNGSDAMDRGAVVMATLKVPDFPDHERRSTLTIRPDGSYIESAPGDIRAERKLIWDSMCTQLVWYGDVCAYYRDASSTRMSLARSASNDSAKELVTVGRLHMVENDPSPVCVFKTTSRPGLPAYGSKYIAFWAACGLTFLNFGKDDGPSPLYRIWYRNEWDAPEEEPPSEPVNRRRKQNTPVRDSGEPEKKTNPLRSNA